MLVPSKVGSTCLRSAVALAQRLIEMKAMNTERTKGERERKERRRVEKEAAKLQAQCAHHFPCYLPLLPCTPRVIVQRDTHRLGKDLLSRAAGNLNGI